MSKLIAYINGEYLPLEAARVSPLDRGFLFGDGVYEVLPIIQGHMLHLAAHINRLNQSLKGIRMQPPLSFSEWQTLLQTLFEKNIESNGPGEYYLYLQVTRGAEADRNFPFPDKVDPTLFAVCFPTQSKTKEELRKGFKAVGVTDIRWKYSQLKTTDRLANVLMRQEAKEAGADEGIIINNSTVLEGTSSNVFIVRHNMILTPAKSNQILSGITRDAILSLAEAHHIPYRETKILERDLLKADELWITSSVRGIHPIIEFNGQPVGTGKAGPLWEVIWDLYAGHCNTLSMSVSH